MRLTVFLGCVAACLCLSGVPALGQSNVQLAPPWAREPLLGDMSGATGGRPTLAGLEADAAVRVTIVPRDGGVARVIRFESHDGAATLALRRFTGHPQQGWWMWGPDTPAVLDLTPDQGEEVIGLAMSAVRFGRTGLPGGDDAATCATGQAAYVEVAQGDGAPFTAARGCIMSDGVSALAVRLSDLAGSRNEGELADAARAELLAQDRAFAAAAEADGAPSAFMAFAREDALLFYPGRAPFEGQTGIAARFAEWPEGARLLWAPRAARVSSRGDMGWTWGEGLFVSGDGAAFSSNYVSIWQRDIDGVWKWVADIGVRGPEGGAPDLQARAAAPAP